MSDKPIIQTSYLDEAVRECPCGASYSWSDCGSKELTDWTTEHKPHSNGKLFHQVGHDWHRIYGERPDDYEHDL